VIEWARDEFDSRLLERGVCKAWLHADDFRADELEALWVRDAPDLVCSFTPCTYRAAAAMQDMGFRLVTVRSTYEAPIGQVPVGAVSPASVRLHRLTDAPAIQEGDLRQLAETIGETSRYFKDPRIPPAAARRVYETWISNSLYGGYAQDVILAFRDDRLIGLHTLRARDGVLTVDLIGVVPEAQGDGLGTVLLQAGVRAGEALRTSRVRVVTEAENIPACRMYQRHGFLLTSTELVWHRHREH
jgi:ribosomal protein S18 acetylase RimI-like enzyme